jgi:hypothetical protein
MALPPGNRRPVVRGAQRHVEDAAGSGKGRAIRNLAALVPETEN